MTRTVQECEAKLAAQAARSAPDAPVDGEHAHMDEPRPPAIGRLVEPGEDGLC